MVKTLNIDSHVEVVRNIKCAVENNSQSQVNKGKTRVFLFLKKMSKISPGATLEPLYFENTAIKITYKY